MSIKKQPFVNYKLEEDRSDDKTIFTIRLNSDERKWLDDAKVVLQQPKDSTAVKTLAEIGKYYVLHDAPTHHIITTIFINKRRNDRSGAPIGNLEDIKSDTKNSL